MRRWVGVWAACVLAAFWSAAGSASAQGVLAAPPPTHYTLDERGVDLISGAFNHSATEVAVGQAGQGGLTFSRMWTGGGWRSNHMGAIAYVGSVYTVSLGGFSDRFTLSGGVYTPSQDRGQTLTASGTTLTYTMTDGTVAVFSPNPVNYHNEQPDQNGGVIRSITYPSGEVVTYTYVRGRVPMPYEPPEKPYYLTTWRLQSIANNLGYQLKLEYLNDDPVTEEDLYDFVSLAKVTGFNMAVDWCDPTAASCSFSQAWPSATYGGGDVTDELGRTTVYTAGSSGLTGVRWPSTSSGNDISIAYTSGRVSSVTVGTNAWTYAYVDAGGNRTTTVTDPLSHTEVVVSELATGRAASATDGLGRTTSFLWDAQGRPTRTTLPEGNYTEVAYGARGNVATTTHGDKPGSPLANITTSTVYPATCANPVTCNLPTSTTDERGGVTDYTWDAGHGGLLTVTQPAPIVGAARPQTRYSYSSLYAWYKDSTGGIVQAPSAVTRLTGVSACATGTTCVGAAAEVKTTIGYGATGVANNRLPVTSTSGDGAGTLAATTTQTWTAAGDVLTVDGPLAGTADTTRYRYDAGRQLVGVVGPDPDGAGALKHRAVRNGYNADGQVTLAEQGTVNGYTDTDWAAFLTLQQVATTYDTIARPVRTTLTAGGTAYAMRQVTYDVAHQVLCTVQRMNPLTFGAPPTSACDLATAGAFGPDRISRNIYDAAGQLTGVTTGYGTTAALTETATYTSNGRPLTLVDGEGNTSTYIYDGFDRIDRLRYPNASGAGSSTTDYESYTYDVASNALTFRNRSAQILAMSYDALSRITFLDAPSDTADIFYTYDNLNRPIQIKYTGFNVGMIWDALGRQTRESGAFGAFNYQYDLGGRRTRLTWPDGYYAQYDYSLYDDVTAIRENGEATGPAVLASYTYDNLGRRIGVTRGNGVVTTYGFDAVSRLTSLAQNLASTASDQTFTFGFNPSGQITNRAATNDAYAFDPANAALTYPVNGLNQATAAGGVTLAYDTRGNLSNDGTQAYTYNAYNWLGTAGSAVFQYDPLGRLYRATLGGADTRFAYDGGQAVAEYNATGGMIRRHVPGPGVDETVVSLEGSGTTDRRWLVADERGSVIAITTSTGAALSTNAYDEYGVPAATNAGRFQYTGQMWLPEAGLYHYKARAYDPALGRFLQTDPIGYAAGANLYAYVGGDPINSTDPSGLDAKVDGTCTYTIVDGQIVATSCSWTESGGTPGCDAACQAAHTRGWAGFFYGHPGMQERDRGIGNYFPGSGSDFTGPPIRSDPQYEPFQASYQAASERHKLMIVPVILPYFAPLAVEWGVSGILGAEIRFGANARLALFGNRTGHPLGRWPHYHRRGLGSNGATRHGQGIKRHRPWEARPSDRSFWDRF